MDKYWNIDHIIGFCSFFLSLLLLMIVGWRKNFHFFSFLLTAYCLSANVNRKFVNHLLYSRKCVYVCEANSIFSDTSGGRLVLFIRVAIQTTTIKNYI